MIRSYLPFSLNRELRLSRTFFIKSLSIGLCSKVKFWPSIYIWVLSRKSIAVISAMVVGFIGDFCCWVVGEDSQVDRFGSWASCRASMSSDRVEGGGVVGRLVGRVDVK